MPQEYRGYGTVALFESPGGIAVIRYGTAVLFESPEIVLQAGGQRDLKHSRYYIIRITQRGNEHL